jgi:hypothetical protein
MKPEEVPARRKNATYVLAQWKLVYVSAPKAACTATKWLLADALEVDPWRFYNSLSTETTRATTIHQNRWKWKDVAPRLRDLTPEQLAEITPENGWMVFSMKRHPAMRLWSAWQSKLLLREPRFMAQFKDADYLPRIPESTDDVIEDWERFVAAIAADPELPILTDNHFAPQTRLLNLPTAQYTKLYDTSEFSTMVSDLGAQLAANGFTGTLAPRRSNETPLPALERAFSPDVVEVISKTFARDYKLLGYADPIPPKLRSGEYSADLIAATGIIAERGDRIGDLSRRARRLAEKAGLPSEKVPQPISEVDPGLIGRVRRRIGSQE